MHLDYLRIYAFNDKEMEILSKNKNIINRKVKLSSKDIKVYFYLKNIKNEIGVTDLVKKCLIEKGYDINAKEMYQPRRKPGSDEFYGTGFFSGNDEYRVDAFNRSLAKLIKSGLVTKRKINKSNSVYSTVVKE